MRSFCGSRTSPIFRGLAKRARKRSDDDRLPQRQHRTGGAGNPRSAGRANHDTALGYGADEWTAALQRRYSELFETAVRVFPVATGTAANALSLAALGPSWGIVYCSEAAHINTSEANAAGFFGGGIKLAPVGGETAGSAPSDWPKPWQGLPGQLHRGQPSAVSLTQASDLGAVYSLDEMRAIAEVAKARGLRCTWTAPALPMRWRGSAAARPRRPGAPGSTSCRSARPRTAARCATRSSCSPPIAEGLAVQLRRAGQVWSKMRFASAQLIAYVENGLWLRARASNAIAARIATGLAGFPARAVGPGRGQRDFPRTAGRAMDALEADGFQFYRRSANLAASSAA